ncbi:hypothetical protein [Pyxidicoccus trucidator]|uniref:hypothetical protein n=1 Tax=Pyxidicoccus trucidator TaxID=2709662 RepID=UPI0013DB1A6B|nr:hypothetical protein [Pyxidicoccus trucidator]
MPKFNFSAVVIALFIAACGGSPSGQPQEPVEPQPGEGVVQIPLVTTSADGQRYRLVGATFTITGPQSVIITDTSTDTVSVPLPAGNYSIRLEGQWSLERVEAPGQPVQASLMSPNPMAFSLVERETLPVRFLFKVPANGTADVGFSVDTGGWFAGTFEFGFLPEGPSPFNTFSVLEGRSVPFVMSWDTATAIRDYDGWRSIRVTTGPITVQFGGPYTEVLHDRLATTLRGQTFQFSLMATEQGSILMPSVVIHSRPGTGFELSMDTPPNFSMVLDAEGYPSARPFDFQTPFTLMEISDSRFGRIQGTARVNASAR